MCFVSVIQIVPCMLRSLERNVCLRRRTCCKCITWCELFEVLNVAQACTRHNICVSMGRGIASVMHRHCLFSVLGYRCDCVNVLLVLFCSGALVVLPVPCCFVFQFRVVGPLFCPFFWLKHLKVALFLVPLSHRETSPEKVKADCRPSPFPTSFLQVTVAPNLGSHL